MANPQNLDDDEAVFGKRKTDHAAEARRLREEAWEASTVDGTKMLLSDAELGYLSDDEREKVDDLMRAQS